MPQANILKTSILSSQGNLEQTIDSIKTNNTKISLKSIPSLDEILDLPYF
jgi:hypothetical protein